MNNKTSFCIGLMSGTSLDGIDICYVKFDTTNNYVYKILKAETISYPELWRKKLVNAFEYGTSELKKLDLEYGEFLGNLVDQFIAENAIEKLDFIASHGHTIFHKPDEEYTLQIGSGKAIAKITRVKVVCDFRTQDVKLGGQGAPLVPIGDELLFPDYHYCLNLGGFANISFRNNGKRIAFDICPLNIVLNHYINKMNLEYDDRGRLAASGEIRRDLLDKLNALEFYRLPYPKSLGLEWVVKFIYPLIDEYNLEIKDVLRTFIEHIAMQISTKINENSTILITGGGALNDFLIKRIEFYLNRKLRLPENTLIHFKEALVFAFLGLLKLNNEINVLRSVTGAKENHSSGVVFAK